MTALYRTAAAACLAAVGIVWPPMPAVAQTEGRVPSAAAQAGTATLYVINDSGKTLIAGKQAVRDNDEKLANLPRHTYQKLTVAAGPHVLRPASLKKPRVEFEAAPGMTYYVVVAYRPDRSWAYPVAGSAMVLTLIAEEDARRLMAEMTEYPRPQPGGK